MSDEPVTTIGHHLAYVTALADGAYRAALERLLRRTCMIHGLDPEAPGTGDRVKLIQQVGHPSLPFVERAWVEVDGKPIEDDVVELRWKECGFAVREMAMLIPGPDGMNIEIKW